MIDVTFNGVGYPVPETGDTDWGSLTDYLVAIAAGALQKSGGTFTLTADVDFGASKGVKLTYLKSRATNIAAAGLIRLGVTDVIGWRNNANSADLALSVNGSNQLLFNSQLLLTSTGTITANRALASNGAGSIISSSVTDTEQGYLSGVTSAIQTQLNAKQATGNYITALTGDVVAAGPGSVAATIQTDAVTTTKILNSAVTSAKIAAGTIVDSNISSSAAIARTKIAPFVGARYTNNTTAAIPTSATVFNFATVDYDPNSIVTTGAAWKATIPAGYSGKWRISATALLNSSAISGYTMEIYKNGTTVTTTVNTSQFTTGNFTHSIQINDVLNLVATDFIQIRIYTPQVATFASFQCVSLEYCGS